MSAPKPFFISGLPRTRTAWLSNLLTTDQTLCFHDTRFFDYLLVNPRRVGFSGPELVTQFDEIAAAFPEAPWVIVLRNKDEALNSFKLWAGDLLPQDDVLEIFWRNRAHAVSGLCKHPNVFTVSYEMMDDEIIAREMWAHLLPGIPFDLERWQLLKKLNVQQDKRSVKPWPSVQ